MKITNIKIYPFDTGSRNKQVRAYAEVEIDDKIIVRGIRIIESKSGGLFIGLPSLRDRSGDYREVVLFKDRETASKFRSLILDALSARSTLGKADHDTENVPVPPHPDQGHKSRRISLGFGGYDGDVFQEIAFRPAFTDLLDMDYIHDKGAQIEFFNGKLRFYPSKHKLYLQKLNLVDIISIAPRDELFNPYSWKFSTGFKRKQIEADDNTLLYHINTGAGISVEDSDLGLCYAMLEPELNIGGALENNYALGGGVSCGVLKQIGSFWRIHALGRNIWFVIGDDHQSGSLEFLNNFKVTQNNHLSLELKREKNWENYTSQVLMLWHYFF